MNICKYIFQVAMFLKTGVYIYIYISIYLWSVNAKNGYYCALPDDGMKICAKCNCGLLYNFRRVATKSRSRTGAERAF